MREKPTLRIPLGILALIFALAAYAMVIVRYLAAPIARLPVLAQVPVYIVLGVVWLLPLRRYLIWMETGHWG